ncbi:MAG: hypothetical protein ACK559_02345, partial [bacterium]
RQRLARAAQAGQPGGRAAVPEEPHGQRAQVAGLGHQHGGVLLQQPAGLLVEALRDAQPCRRPGVAQAGGGRAPIVLPHLAHRQRAQCGEVAGEVAPVPEMIPQRDRAPHELGEQRAAKAQGQPGGPRGLRLVQRAVLGRHRLAGRGSPGRLQPPAIDHGQAREALGGERIAGRIEAQALPGRRPGARVTRRMADQRARLPELQRRAPRPGQPLAALELPEHRQHGGAT